ncbi:MAG TPA: hypothetical protein DCP75_10930 [Haliea salexigens]|uniref:Uncharacterized protein n=1 Tax=Haliea salexigens TaxID=287487 RepID=A0A3C1KP20_9GAMM|nr:hypothetical protein [Haliea sp.]MAD62644.1 hypothetical protein [Haliea sp.]HAN28213.1 hypothetical protein [Haliea salexigens]
MYFYSVDRTLTFTSEDMVLFKESPFACWMERLTLENPAHGVAPDAGSSSPGDSARRQDAVAELLANKGRQVILIDWDAPEALRRSDTLAAMRSGTEFIVNGQLAVGPLAASSQLLMRTSGYSELGNHLYIPCDLQGKTNRHDAFRLCFLADLLHSVQGVLPPQMVMFRRGGQALHLKTEDHIFHYRAVKQHFMAAQREFRKHRMPDPALSVHFGRWSACANDVLRQRALQGDAHWQTQERHELALTPPECDVPLARERTVETTDAALQGLEFIGSGGASMAFASGGRAARAGDRRRRPVPPAALGEALAPPADTQQVEPLSHPLDAAGFSVARRFETPPRRRAPVPHAEPPGNDVDREQAAPRRFTPVPFSSSLNTSDSFEG